MSISYFSTVNKGNDEIDLAAKNRELLRKSLEFTSYFSMIHNKILTPDNGPKAAPPMPNFKKWTDSGVEILITGNIEIIDKSIKLKLRLYDTVNKKMLLGKSYKTDINNSRRVIHRFCSEVIYCITGNRGIFYSKIAFLSSSTGNKEIYISAFDGYKPKRFTHSNSITLFPAWSSDGKWIAYTSFAKGKPDIFIKSLDKRQSYLINFKGTNSTPAWVPGKFELAASLSYSGDPEIYLLTGTGKINKRLTRSRDSDLSPTWSPDGTKMAFVSKRAGTPQIYIKDIASGKTARLTFMGKYNTQPEWSPKGDKITYSAIENGEINIYVIDSEGKYPPVRLTHNAGNNESPSWSPDGSLIVFSSTRGGDSKIYVMNAFGTDQRRLLSMPGEQTNPKWSPRF